MIELYHKISKNISKDVTQTYSTSFSLGIKLLDKSIHNAIYSIYGFVRLADEIVDSFHDYPKAQMLKEFKEETYKSIERKISVNPILHSFQNVVNEYKIDMSLIDQFLKSMEQDLDDIKYSNDAYKEYIVGSAEVVGLMCLKVFVNGDEKLYSELEDSARSLGAAFQKINFLRDIKADYSNLGRTYFPNVDMNTFSLEDKVLIERDIQKDFEHALKGVKKLPKSSRAGVYLTYVYYYKLFEKIQSISYSKILSQRIRIHNFRKMYLVLGTLLKSKFGLI